MMVIALSVIAASGLIFYQVDEREYVVITQFGEPIKAIKKAGLNWKWPDPIQSVNRYNINRRIIHLEHYCSRCRSRILKFEVEIDGVFGVQR